jgi:hypothetical protein
MQRRGILIASLVFCSSFVRAGSDSVGPISPIVTIEEAIYSFTPANNGAGPLWNFGSTNLVRIADELFFSGLETDPKLPPLNNTRCTVWRRDSQRWQLMMPQVGGWTREPCPLVAFPARKRVLLSANPTLNSPSTPGGGPAQPVVVEYSIGDSFSTSSSTYPVWRRTPSSPSFTEHSYRSFAADGANGELILLHNIGYTHAEWAFRASAGQWLARGILRWPSADKAWGDAAIRLSYANVALDRGAVHFVAVSDVQEPNGEWRQLKRHRTGRQSDFVYRQLFYTWNPDIVSGKFGQWFELSNREKAAGRITPGDLWISADGAAHVIWSEAAIDTRLRDAFFPEEKQRFELNYAVLRHGKLVARNKLLETEEGQFGPVPHLPRFHVTPENRLFVFFYVNGTDANGRHLSENWLAEIDKDDSLRPPVRIPLVKPLSHYMTATVRAGSRPSRDLDLVGTSPEDPTVIRYARVRIY